MNIVLQSAIQTLQKSDHLLKKMSDAELSNNSVSPYYSSIGSHLRHIFDFYNCILNEIDNRVDLTARKRNTMAETCCNSALDYLDHLIIGMKKMDQNLDREIYVIDDLGMGKIEMKYTLGALLAQANSHTIHHYAIINYILDRLKISVEDEAFGYNPSTPKPEVTLN